jgi:hypothetical protein
MAKALSLTRSKSVGGGCEHEFMTGDDHDDTLVARDAVVDARREAAAALARLAEAAVHYADARLADDTAAGIGSGHSSRVRPGEFVADELAVMLRDQPYPVRHVPVASPVACRPCGRPSAAASWTPTRSG